MQKKIKRTLALGLAMVVMFVGVFGVNDPKVVFALEEDEGIQEDIFSDGIEHSTEDVSAEYDDYSQNEELSEFEKDAGDVEESTDAFEDSGTIERDSVEEKTVDKFQEESTEVINGTKGVIESDEDIFDIENDEIFSDNISDTTTEKEATFDLEEVLTEESLDTPEGEIVENQTLNAQWEDSIEENTSGEENNNASIQDDFEYEIYNGKANIVKYNGNDKEVIVPAHILVNGISYPVEKIGCFSSSIPVIGGMGSCFDNKVSKVVISKGIKSIGINTFCGCSGLLSVEIPDSVTEIGDYAFFNCRNITNIRLPNSVVKIGAEAFSGCKALLSIEIPYGVNALGSYVFNNCTGLKEVIIPDSVNKIGYCSFQGCSGLTSIYLPNSIVSIDEYAFDGCSGLLSVNIPKNVNSLSGDVFRGCAGLISMEIPDGVVSIGDYAFSECKGLESVKLPKSVTYIGLNAFADCNNLKSIYYAGSEEQWNAIENRDIKLDYVKIYYKVERPSDSNFNITLDHVRYEQTEARSMTGMINAWRTGETWYWNKDDISKTEFGKGELSPLIYDYGLEKIAMKRAAEVAVSFSHTRPDGRDCFSAYEECVPGISYSQVAENIAIGQKNAENVFMSWREDNDSYEGQGHRRNMLQARMNRVGIGHCLINGTHIWVQNFSDTLTNVTDAESYDNETKVDISITDDALNSKDLRAFRNNTESCVVDDTIKGIEDPGIWLSTKETFTVGDDGGGVAIQKEPITYRSSDPKTVEVMSDGTMKALSKGMATVEASVIFRGFVLTDTVDISVRGKTQKISGTLKYEKNLRDEPFILDLKASTRLSYISDNPAIAEISPEGMVTLKGAGKATITAIADASDLFESAEETVTIIVKENNVSKPEENSGSKDEESEQGVFKASVKTNTIFIGEKTSIDYSKLKEGWRTRCHSSNYLVAYVSDSGEIIGKSKGTAIISIYAQDILEGGRSDTISFKITIKELIEQKITKAISKTNTLVSGQNTSINIMGTNLKGKKVFSSSNTKVATVNANGIIKAKMPGKVTISVYVRGTGHYCESDVVKFLVTVKPISVKSVKLNKKSITVKKGKKLTLKATISPSNATNKSVTWKSSNKKIATVSSKGVVKGVKKGKATITVTTKDGKKTASCKVTVK